MLLYYDNQATHEIANNYLVQHDYSKHVELDMHFIKEKLSLCQLMFFIYSSEQLAGILINVVFIEIFKKSLGKLHA